MGTRKHNELAAGNVILPGSGSPPPQKAVVTGPPRLSREPGLWIVPIRFTGDPEECIHFMRNEEEVELAA